MQSRPEPTHHQAWAGALLSFVLFTALFAVGEIGGHHWPLLFLRAIMFGAAVALFCIGWTMREREKDEPIIELLLAERERVLHQRRDAAGGPPPGSG